MSKCTSCRFSTKLVIVGVLCGCTFDGSNSANLDIVDAGTVDAPVVNIDAELPDSGVSFGFVDEFEEWAVPDSNTVGGFFTTDFGNANKSWFLQDLTKDGVLDLVQTQDPQTSQVWRGPEPYWKVFVGQADGFSEVPLEWKVPVTLSPFGFNRQSGNMNSERWAIRDLTGDDCPDFVRLLDPSTGTVWLDEGKPYWEVYTCLSEGFSQMPLVWYVPALNFDELEHCDNTKGCWGIRKLTGSTRAQLIHTSGVGPNVPFTDPMPFWMIYESTTTTGFDSGPIRWSIPVDVDSTSTFHRLDSANGGSFWQLLDLNGDSDLQLVQSRPFNTATPMVFNLEGVPGWKVFDNNNTSGFEEETSWQVPVTDQVGGFFAVTRTEQALRWAVLDLNGDQRPDLVHTANSQIAGDAIWNGSQGDFWKVYFGSDNSSFVTTGVDWAVPSSGTSAGFYSISQNTTGEKWSLIDLDGDSSLELVQTSDPSTDEVWINGSSEPIWRVYRTN